MVPARSLMYYVYILHNSTRNFIYIGYSENLKQRFQLKNTLTLTPT
ncbi:GIY-YIG nuclease family protein [Candidatus Amesbacteria bacterium]|nr:GIY-YIG nuclease family protein [Candidatus Amesbacteria bacterium]